MQTLKRETGRPTVAGTGGQSTVTFQILAKRQRQGKTATRTLPVNDANQVLEKPANR
ncbi:MAG: hypothetical protein U1G07_20600 [Verrucomicrobiota bacterium]